MAFTRALAEAILAPGRPSWRLVALGDRPAQCTSSFVLAISVVIAVGKVLEALNEAIAAALPLSVATKGIFALLAALTLAELLRRFATTGSEEEECFGPYLPTETDVGWPVRVLGWSAVAAVIASVLLGYVAFATFLVDQAIYLFVVAAVLVIADIIAQDGTAAVLQPETRRGAASGDGGPAPQRAGADRGPPAGRRPARGAGGRVRRGAEALGRQSQDMFGALRSAYLRLFDRRRHALAVVDDRSPVVFASRLFRHPARPGLARLAASAADRLDAGVRNSVRTIFGYLGFFVAASSPGGYIGLDCRSIAIVAGGLSVGIGFGLQSIVNNFVSGLILL